MELLEFRTPFSSSKPHFLEMPKKNKIKTLKVTASRTGTTLVHILSFPVIIKLCRLALLERLGGGGRGGEEKEWSCTRKMGSLIMSKYWFNMDILALDLLFLASVFASTASSTLDVLRQPHLTLVIPQSPVHISPPPWTFLYSPQTSQLLFGTLFVICLYWCTPNSLLNFEFLSTLESPLAFVYPNLPILQDPVQT